MTPCPGEYFHERGRFLHGGDVYRELVHVPLIIGGAIPEALRGRTVPRTVELVSLPKTIAALAGIRRTPFQGEDLVRVARQDAPKPRYAFAEGTWAWKKTDRTVGVKYRGWKLVHHLDGNRYELFRTRTDKAEKKNLWKRRDTETTKMKRRLKSALDRHIYSVTKNSSRGKKVNLTPEEKSRLRALGYVE